MNIIITMAGRGKRFWDVGFDIPKYQIKAGDRTLFSWSLLSLKNFMKIENTFIFIARKEDDAGEFIKKECELMAIDNYRLVEVEMTTDGQATTVLYAKDEIQNRENSILIYNIDTHVSPDFLSPDSIQKGDGWIPCFPGKGKHWSFAKLNQNGRVVEVREKQRISDHATIGLYWFSSYALYRQIYDEYYSDHTQVEQGEKFIAPLYNQLIKDEKTVYIHEVPLSAVHCLGTPEELDTFQKINCDPSGTKHV